MIRPDSTSPSAVPSTMIGEQGDKNYDRNRYAQQIKQEGSHSIVPSLNDLYVIALPAANGRRVARTESAHQQRQKRPQQDAGGDATKAINCLASFQDRFGYPPFSLGGVESRL